MAEELDMPNCFTLTRKLAPQEGPVKMALIDDEMRVHFGSPPDAKSYYCYWYDVIGFALACGRSLVELIACYQCDWMDKCEKFDWNLCLIAQWLDDNFTADAWAEVGGRR